MIDSIVKASVCAGASALLRPGMPGRQAYFFVVTGPANARALSVVSFKAVERMGKPYRIVIALTKPEAPAREDYLKPPPHGKGFELCSIQRTSQIGHARRRASAKSKVRNSPQRWRHYSWRHRCAGMDHVAKGLEP